MPIRQDGIQLGQSPRFTAAGAAQSVRKGKGIVVGVSIGVSAPAASTITLKDNPSAGAVTLFNLNGQAIPGFYPVYQDFSSDLTVDVVSTPDFVVITGGE